MSRNGRQRVMAYPDVINFHMNKTVVEIGTVVRAGELSDSFPLENVQWNSVLSKMEGGGGPMTNDDISRRHKISYEIKNVEIGPEFGTGKMVLSFGQLF
ncbi:hypothetical protein AVEN_100415-1 [Araneus ventricosus]|uniref:Uncharacterized protein n=1 Tax=Araneus ventricosus TaxID=182803 RepID=A0A4Y2D0J7_ARAVE|nr:hypothetical protein AVEN_100415-1 [Araneus ventricosus]